MEAHSKLRKNKIKKTFRINPDLLEEVRKILGVQTQTEAIEKALEQIRFKIDLKKWIDRNAGRYPNL
jgi:phenylalanyl-tRNA synthetase beta subunit